MTDRDAHRFSPSPSKVPVSKSALRLRFLKEQALQDRCEGISQKLAIKDYLTRKLLSKDNRLFDSERSVSQLQNSAAEAPPAKIKVFDVDLELDSQRDRMAD
jgi:hypothetical protein